MHSLTLQVVQGRERGRLFKELNPPVTLGREDGNTICFFDEKISRFHSTIFLEEAGFVIVDLDSTNGTRVNGHYVNRQRLEPGDRIRIGGTEILFGSESQINANIQAEGAPLYFGQSPVPPLPVAMSPSQAARMAELFDFLHTQVGLAIEGVKIEDDEVSLEVTRWSRFLALRDVISRYSTVTLNTQRSLEV